MTQVSSAFIKALAILETHLADGAVATAKLGNGAVTNAKTADRTLTAIKLVLQTITEAEIATGTLVSRVFSAGAVNTAALADGAVTSEKIGPGEVESINIAAGGVGSANIADGALTQNHYGAVSIQTSHLADGSVSTAKLGLGAVTPANIQALTANRVLITNSAGTITPLAAGAEGQSLMVTGGDIGWGSTSIPLGVLVPYFGLSAPSGWVIANGTTIGSLASSADQKSDSYQALFEFLWNSHANSIIAVVGGRGVSATADWAANKAIATPDMRARGPIGVDTVSSSSTRLDAAYVDAGGAITQVGSVGGHDKIALSSSNIPEHSHLMFVDGRAEPPSGLTDVKRTGTNSVYSSGDYGPADDAVFYRMAYSSTYLTPTVGRSGPAGSGSSPTHENMPPFILVNYIMKA